jgi:hypothetical protein
LIEGQEGVEQEDFQAVLRAAGETETTQENIQDWFELLTEEEITAVIFFNYLHQHYIYY